MPPSDGVKCEACRNWRRECISTAGPKCERCTKHNLVCVIMSPPASIQAQREARRDPGARRPHQSRDQADNDSVASFDSLFDEPTSKAKSKPGLPSHSNCLSTRKIGTKSPQTKNANPTIFINRQKTTTVIRKRPSERTPPQSGSPSGHASNRSDGMPVEKKQRLATPTPTTPRQNPVSPAPVAKMVSTERNPPKLWISQPLNATPTPLLRTRETSISTPPKLWISQPLNATLTPKTQIIEPSISTDKTLPSLSIPQSVTTTPTPHPQTQEPSTHTASTTKDLPTTPNRRPQSLSPSHHDPISNRTLKIHLHGSQGFKPLLLKSCLEPSTFFSKILSTWSLSRSLSLSPPSSSSSSPLYSSSSSKSPNKTTSLHITFPWLPRDHSNSLMILKPDNVEAGLVCMRDEIERAPCWRGGVWKPSTITTMTITTSPTTAPADRAVPST